MAGEGSSQNFQKIYENDEQFYIDEDFNRKMNNQNDQLFGKN